ncbi:T9SS type A sorting domain-containing protein [Flavihumibacter rivuli]|uniref:T9SS type A sorting domain-containing protein n=1 Tax=Flavihumibacter rivuli TaxID=2838156 RepID=UPI001EFA90BC|nr:sialate O-acetylesterase [Flavihumibacter rivuli]ULQ58443.1 T9SS type A sorting domain-containing protein [Flavihumibacter rivuli]
MVKKYRDGSLINTSTIVLAYQNNKASYLFKETITAELHSYSFELLGSTGTNETLIQAATNVVAGDAYIIEGQSNAVANNRTSPYTVENDANTITNAPQRAFVRVWGSGSQTASYTKAWFVGNGNSWYENDGNTGQWGMRLASNLAGAQNIPIALLNGAHPGESIAFFQRNDANPTDPSTNYGRLLKRTEEAGLKNKIRGIIWYQGESDAQGVLSSNQMTTAQWKQMFRQLYQDWKTDYPKVSQVYIIQTRFGCGITSRDGALQIQEAQRQLAVEIPYVKIMTTNNLDHLMDGGSINYCHFAFEKGYKQLGDWLTNLLRRDLYYVSGLPGSIEPPQPMKASFSAFTPTGEANQVMLQIKGPANGYTIDGDIAADLRLEGGSYTITGVAIQSNKLLVNFTRNAGTNNNPSAISYLGHEGKASPVLFNANGIGLTYFANFPISKPGNPPIALTCTDLYDRDNSEANNIKLGKTVTAIIKSSSDVDWFKFKADDDKPYMRISLFKLPADYDIYLYDKKKKLMASSTATGNNAEVIFTKVDKKQDEHFYIKVIGKNGAFNPGACYSLKVECSKNKWPTNSGPATSTMSSEESQIDGEDISLQKVFNIYPNPARTEINISLSVDHPGSTEIRIIDMTGKQLLMQRNSTNSGLNRLRLNVSNIPPGIYLLQIANGETTTIKKLTIIK